MGSFRSELKFRFGLGVGFALLAVSALVLNTQASANTYTIYTCNHAADQGYGYVDNLFTYTTDDSSRTEEINDCDGSTSGRKGIGVQDKLGSGGGLLRLLRRLRLLQVP